jgi:uncharacterized surface protein with fasciclin (FAS1) repeats
MKSKNTPERPARESTSPNGSSNGPSAIAGPANDSSPMKRRQAVNAHEHDIVTTAEGSTRLRIFVELVRAAGLTDMLRSAGPFTVFAPTDRAFDRVAQRDFDALLADTGRLTKVLGHHVVQGRVKAPQPEAPRTATPINGADLTLTSRIDAYHVNEARLVQTNIRASNGVIHAIDKLLVLA